MESNFIMTKRLRRTPPHLPHQPTHPPKTMENVPTAQLEPCFF
jgi:hypothetical protein